MVLFLVLRRQPLEVSGWEEFQAAVWVCLLTLQGDHSQEDQLGTLSLEWLGPRWLRAGMLQ